MPEASYPSYVADYNANGRLLAIKRITAGQAALPVDDRGFLYGDAIFETYRFDSYGAVPYAAYHQDRLERGCGALRIPAPSICVARIARMYARIHHVRSGILRVHISAGSGGGGYARPRLFNGRCVLSYRSLSPLKHAASLLALPSSFLHNVSGYASIKHTCRAGYCAGSDAAKRKGYDDALFVDKQGYAVECGSSNIFAIYGRHIITPPLSSGALAGTCRARVLERAKQYVTEEPLHVSMLRHADLVFITNACTGLRRVRTINGQQIAYKQSIGNLSTAESIFRRLLREERAVYALS